MGCKCNNAGKAIVGKDLKLILDLSFKYCEAENQELALFAQQVNAKTYQVMKFINRSGSNCCAGGCNESCSQ